MTPPMYKRVRNFIAESGLLTGYIIQNLIWTDDIADTRKTKSYVVFRPNGGTNPDRELGSEHYTMVDVISARGPSAHHRADNTVNAIVDYVQKNPISDSCLGQITCLGAVPAPVLSAEGRLIYRLQFACLYGE
ncbi:hypothetical protein [Entomohabitans teleogrylli]|uniref:phage tail termination protein n=1 Tax=Entomohabitans teleogrylli TaxID=1384589 RepID=UPI00073D7D8A|nr:hypothetical protein [Entomohabitans teleogrylli]